MAAGAAQTCYSPRIDNLSFGRAENHNPHLRNSWGMHDRLIVLVEYSRGEEEIGLLTAAAEPPLPSQPVAIAGALQPAGGLDTARR